MGETLDGLRDVVFAGERFALREVNLLGRAVHLADGGLEDALLVEPLDLVDKGVGGAGEHPGDAVA